MKVIFLDIDGVLNRGEWYGTPDGKSLERVLLQRLARLVQATGAKLVLSSTWRERHSLEEMVERFGAAGYAEAPFVGATPVGAGKVRRALGEPLEEVTRGDEIRAWLAGAKAVERFVILDDNADMGRLRQYLVQTDGDVGLLEEHVERAQLMLQVLAHR